MYYGDSQNPYKNDKLNHYVKIHLPMDEFARGDFSQGCEIIRVYKEYLALCLTQATKRYIGDDSNIETHLRKELQQLETQHKELSEQKAKIVKKIKERELPINNLKQEYENDRTRQAIRNKFKHYQFDKEPLEDFFDNLKEQNREQYTQAEETHQKFITSPFYKDIGRTIEGKEAIQKERTVQKDNKIRQIIYRKLEEFDFDKQEFEGYFTRLEDGYPDDYQKGEKIYKEIINAPYYQNLTRTVWKDPLYQLNSKRDTITRTLSHKGNTSNVEQKIKDIKTGKERRHIEKYIQEEIEKILRKRDHMDKLRDTRNIEDMFMSIMTTQLITDIKTDKRLREDIIRNHTDKIGLFHHIWRIYTGYPQSVHNLINHQDSTEGTVDIKEKNIVSLTQDARDILEKMSDTAYFWIQGISQEEAKMRDSMGPAQRKKQTIHALISHLEVMLRGEKNCTWEGLDDPQLSKLLKGISDLTESHEFEDLCKEIRDIDFRRNRDMLMINGKFALEQIFTHMSSAERETLEYDYQSWNTFEDIKKEVLQQTKSEQEKQLLLFDLPEPIKKEMKEEQGIVQKKTRTKKKKQV